MLPRMTSGSNIQVIKEFFDHSLDAQSRQYTTLRTAEMQKKTYHHSSLLPAITRITTVILPIASLQILTEVDPPRLDCTPEILQARDLLVHLMSPIIDNDIEIRPSFPHKSLQELDVGLVA